jgi:hypothetical protein
MANTGLHGHHLLTEKEIDKVVRGTGPGAYALGHEANGTFYVDYIGRSDSDLNGRLKQWASSKYMYFKYGFFDTAKAAFEKECRMFHDFGGTATLDNKVHPARPEGASYGCPVSGCGDLR